MIRDKSHWHHQDVIWNLLEQVWVRITVSHAIIQSVSVISQSISHPHITRQYYKTQVRGGNKQQAPQSVVNMSQPLDNHNPRGILTCTLLEHNTSLPQKEPSQIQTWCAHDNPLDWSQLPIQWGSNCHWSKWQLCLQMQTSCQVRSMYHLHGWFST